LRLRRRDRFVRRGLAKVERQQLALRRRQRRGVDGADDAAGARAFVRAPLDHRFAHFRPPRHARRGHDATLRVALRHARVVQGDDFPLIVEHRRARRAGRRVGAVVDEALEQVDHFVLAKRQLLFLPVGVLDDADRFADADLALGLQQRQEPELRQRIGAGSVRHRNDRKVERGVGQEQVLRPQRERHHAVGRSVEAALEVELDQACGRLVRAAKDVVVRDEHARRDQEAGAEADDRRARSDDDAAHRAGGAAAAFQVVEPHEVLAAEDALEPELRGVGRDRRRRHQFRRARRGDAEPRGSHGDARRRFDAGEIAPAEGFPFLFAFGGPGAIAGFGR
jgi:hypothetical protein